MNNKFNPYLEIIIATIFFGFNGVLAKLINLPPTSVVFFRLTVPLLFFLIYLLIKKSKLFKIKSKLIYAASTLNAVRIFLFYLGLSMTYVGFAVTVFYIWPIFAAIIGAIFLKEDVKSKWPFIVLAFVGVVVIYFQKDIPFTKQDVLGLTIMLAAAAIYAVTVSLYKKESNKFTNYELVFFQNLVGAVVFLPVIFINKPFPNLIQSAYGIGIGLGVGIIGFSLFFSALKKIPSYKASNLTYFEVVFAIIFAIIFLSEPFTWNLALGGILIVGSAYFVSKKKVSK